MMGLKELIAANKDPIRYQQSKLSDGQLRNATAKRSPVKRPQKRSRPVISCAR